MKGLKMISEKEMALASAVERMHMSGDDEWPNQWEIAVVELAEELGIDDTEAERMLSDEMGIPRIAWYILDYYEEETILHDNILC